MNVSSKRFISVQEATEYCLDAVATFTSYELMDYKEFIVYSVILAMEALERPKLRDKVWSSLCTRYRILDYLGFSISKQRRLD